MVHNVEVVKEVEINKKVYKLGESLSVSKVTFDLYKENFKEVKIVAAKKDKVVVKK